MKNAIILLILFFWFSNTFAQNTNSYKINDEILITEIELKIKNNRRVYEKGEIFGVRFIRINDSLSVYSQITHKNEFECPITDEPIHDWNDVHAKCCRKVKTSDFDAMVKSFERIKIHEKVGYASYYPEYKIKLSNYNFAINLKKLNPYYNTKERKLESFLAVCEKMMSYIKNNKYYYK